MLYPDHPSDAKTKHATCPWNPKFWSEMFQAVSHELLASRETKFAALKNIKKI